MNTTPAPTRRSRLSRVATRATAAVTAALLAGVLAGCGVRLETPPPAEPVPDAAELVRRTAVSDALGVADVAGSALEQPELDEKVASELTRVQDHALAHADALGGEYDSGIEREPELDELLESPAVEEPPATTADVVQALTDAAGRSRTAANTAADGDIARLLASIGASQAVSATRLAGLVGVDGPTAPQPVVPAPAATDDSASPSPEEEANEAAEPSANGTRARAEATDPSPETQDDSPAVVATTAPGEEEVVPPVGLSAAEYRAVILSEDGARFTLEVLAALSAEPERSTLVAQAAIHRERARAWAALAGVEGTAQDPRVAAYQIPRDQDTAAIVRDLATGRARDYATLVGTTASGTRGVLVDLLIDAALTLNTWGADPLPFPGMPELA